jgi:hypothetical protein
MRTEPRTTFDPFLNSWLEHCMLMSVSVRYRGLQEVKMEIAANRPPVERRHQF